MKLKLTYAPLALLLLAGCGGDSEPKLTAPKTVGSVPAPQTEKPPTDAKTNAKMAQMPTPLATPATMSEMPAPTGEDKAAPMPNAAQPQNFRVRGEVVEVIPAKSGNEAALTVKHEDIPGFMPAMQMRVPLADAGEAAKVKPGDKIIFDMNRDNTAVSNIEMLPASTALKLEK